MNQIYYTSCRLNRSVNGQSGFQVRASSPGLDPHRLRATSGYVGYKLPDHFSPTPEAVAKAPVRLAIFDTPDLGRVLAHSVYIGQEGHGTRGGNFFTHLVLDLPSTFDPAVAAGLWGHPFWRRSDGDDFGTVLPTPVIPASGKPDSAAFLTDARMQEMLGFLLDVLLLPVDAGRKVYLAAKPQEVAVCVFLAASVLPVALRRALTFSTYEGAPAASRALIVGIDPDEELPAYCFTEPAFGFHRGTGRKSATQRPSEFSKYVIPKLAAGKQSDVEKFIHWLTQRQATTPELVEAGLIVRAKRQEKLSPEQVGQVLGNSGLAQEYLQLPDVSDLLTPEQLRTAVNSAEVLEVLLRCPPAVDRLVTLACEDPIFHQDVVPIVVDVLRASGEEFFEGRELSDHAVGHLNGWVALKEMETDADLDAARMKYIGQVLDVVPPAARKSRQEAVVNGVAKALKSSHSPNLLRTVESAVAYLRPDKPGAVYASLCRYFTERAAEVRSPAGAAALLAVGFGQCEDGKLARKLGDEASGHATNLVRALKAAGKGKLLIAVKREAKNWDQEPRHELQDLLRPPLILRIIGSIWFLVFVVVLVLGGAAGAIVWKWDIIAGKLNLKSPTNPQFPPMQSPNPQSPPKQLPNPESPPKSRP